MADGKVYEIRTVADFLAVPLESLDNCMADFAMHIAVAQHFAAQVMPEGLGAKHLNPDVFRWIDDGKHDMNLTVSFQSGDEATK